MQIKQNKKYSKHYYIEGQRICSKLGGGLANSLIDFDSEIPVIESNYSQIKRDLYFRISNNTECVTMNPENFGLLKELNSLEELHYADNTERDLYFYHSDHLGSSSFITDADGITTQHLQYLPYGELFVEQRSTANYFTPYKFSAKEKDEETSYSYFGARYLASDFSFWLSVDPMADKYPNISSYAYCALNPVMLVDPDGRDIVIWYKESGKPKSFNFNGSNFDSAPNNPFVGKVLDAYKYNVKNGGGLAMKEAATNNKYKIRLSETDLSDGQSNGDVYWNPEAGLLTDDNYVLSPATNLEHEIDHALDVNNNPNHLNDTKNNGTTYSNKEEKRVITGNETKTAKANKEIPANKKYSRNNHGGKNVITNGPTSTKINQTKTKGYNEKIKQKAEKFSSEW